MAWLDNERDYYREPSGPLRQGDIVLAPTAILVDGFSNLSSVAPASFGEEVRIGMWRATTGELPEAPAISADVRWGPAMVLPHACALEKEFNERVVALMKDGVSEQDAIELASAEPLDMHVAVAPVRTYDELPSTKRHGVRYAQSLGMFPVVQSATYALEAGWADLQCPTTLLRRLLSKNMRVASLSELAAAYLRAALAKHWAYRDLTREDELSHALGHRIVEIAVAPMPKERLRVGLLLEGDAGSLTLEGSGKPAPPNRAAIRPL
jgi:hypothetical protein